MNEVDGGGVSDSGWRVTGEGGAVRLVFASVDEGDEVDEALDASRGVARRVGDPFVFGAPREREAVVETVAAAADDVLGEVLETADEAMDDTTGGVTGLRVPDFGGRDVVERGVLSLRAGMANSVQSHNVCRAFR